MKRNLARNLTIIATPIVLGLGAYLGVTIWKAESSAKFLTDFQTLQDGKAKMTIAQVENLLGAPTHIEQSESGDQAISGAVYHYPTTPPGGDLKVVFVNGILNHTELPPGGKS